MMQRDILFISGSSAERLKAEIQQKKRFLSGLYQFGSQDADPKRRMLNPQSSPFEKGKTVERPITQSYGAKDCTPNSLCQPSYQRTDLGGVGNAANSFKGGVPQTPLFIS